MKKYVVIGNGTAAVGCIEGIRSVDDEGPINVISAENHPVYSRPLISYYLEDKTDLERIKYRPDGFYEDNGCTVLYGVSAVSVDPDNKTVSLSNGDTLGYDELCVAAGSSPFVPPMQGLDTVESKFSFMTLNDALALEKALTPESRVLIIGAGLIGLKCAEGIFD
ncbi:MAG: FAD-dependent oxidoreductase, partial [Clostridia bacterium]|nr:FAD-dependent oxidoreductase [Clostridia bacterium]